MQRNQEKISAGGAMIIWLFIGNTIILEKGFISDPVWYKLAYISIPLLLLSCILFYRRQS